MNTQADIDETLPEGGELDTTSQDVPETPEAPPEPKETPLEAMDRAEAEMRDGVPPPAPREPEGEERDPEKAAKAEGEQDDPDKPAAPPDVDAEVKDLHLRGRSEQRFRELSGQVETYRSALEQAGVKDIADLPALVQQAQYADQMMADITASFAEPEHYSRVLQYGADIRAAQKGDRQAAERAFEALMPEMQALATYLGKDIAGADPLAEHPDLSAAVESGEIDRKWALQMAANRTQDGARQQHEQFARSQQQIERDALQGVQMLTAWDQQMQADPAYMAKRPALDRQMQWVRENVPPSRWVEAAQNLLAAIPDPAPQVSKPPPGPVRPGRSPGTPLHRTPRTPLEAMDMAEAEMQAEMGGGYR